MPPGTYGKLLAGSLLALASAAVYAYVGLRVGKRRVNPASRLPLVAFSAWWILLGAATAVTALLGVLASFHVMDADAFIAFTYGGIFLISCALACLLYHLVFLFTGKAGAWKILAPAYYLYGVFLVYFIRSHHPTGIRVDGWNLDLTYGVPLREDPLFLVLVVLLVGPPILAALGYLVLAFRAKEGILRYRVVMVSCALILWFGSTFAAALRGLSDVDAWQLGSRLVALAATLAIYWAYYPPRLLRRRFGLVSIDEASEARIA